MKAFLINLLAVCFIFFATITAFSGESAWRRIAMIVVCLVIAAALLTPDKETTNVS